MEWKEVRLGDIADVQTGPFGSQLHKENYVNKGTPIVTVEHLGNKWFTSQNLPMVSDEDKLRLAKYCSQEGDVIFSRVGSVDRCSYVSKEYSGWLFSGRCLRVRPRSGINPEYLYYFLTNEGTKQYIRNIAVGATMPSINTKLLNEVPITIPSLEDQRRIASILSSLDRKIELNNKINADLEEMAQAIFKNWFVDFEPFKDGKFVDSELGMIPEGWKVGCLGDLITIKYGKDHKKLEDGTFPVYGSGGFMRFVNSWLYDGESVLIPRKGTLDNIMYVCEKFWTVDTMFFSVPKMDYVMKYVYNYIKRFDFSKMNEGTSVPSNTAARLNKMPILIPTHEILEMYDETLCPIYNKRKMKDKESRILSLLRDTLLPRLMSGELEVPE
jgi:restriction modification system DNA specificity domain protein